MVKPERKAEILSGIIKIIVEEKGLRIDQFSEALTELRDQLHADGLTVSMAELKDVCGGIMRQHIEGTLKKLDSVLSKI